MSPIRSVHLRPMISAAVVLSAILFPPLNKAGQASEKSETHLAVGFAETDITPKLGPKPVYIAGFGQNRKAKDVHDLLMARAVVLKDRRAKIALVSVDLVGFFRDSVEKVRQKLKGFDYVLVSATHNHEGPDTLGLWGPHPFQSGVDPEYLAAVEEKIVAAVRAADTAKTPAFACFGTSRAPELLHDSREPQVKHDELVAVEFRAVSGGKRIGVLVQWNCHPETLDARNQSLSADFVGATVAYLTKKRNCPVAYFTGTVGGLMTSLRVPVKDDRGNDLKDGTWEKTKKYGELVGMAAEKALANAEKITLTPIEVRTKSLFLPIDNKLYVLAWRVGVFRRQAFYWQGDIAKAEPVKGAIAADRRVCVATEIGWLKLGQLDVAAIPGEIYPELVLDKVEDPAPKGADFPDAPAEPAVYAQLHGRHRMLIGLANDEIGYIIPKRQWDAAAPFCYGRKRAPYGEVNSLGPETAPLLCNAFRDLVRGK